MLNLINTSRRDFNTMRTLEILFWIFSFLVFYTFIGYGILLYFVVKIKEFIYKDSNTTKRRSEELPVVTLLIAAYNEEEVVVQKMSNCQSIDYPKGKLKIVWVTDGSDDNTNKILSLYKDVRLLFQPKRLGKTAALNRAIPLLDTSIIIFTDANTLLNPDAVSVIVGAFNDPNVGCVAGEKRISSDKKDNASSGGEGIYWMYESKLKDLDSRLYSAAGAAGELFAIRKELFEPIEKEILLDDFIMSMRIAAKGFRIKYCKDAYAIESGSLNTTEEKKRKVRIAAGGLQSIFILSSVLSIRKHPLFFFQYISHRVLRWSITPVILFMLFPLNLWIVLIQPSTIYIVLLILQILFYLTGFIGKKLEERKIRFKILFIPYYFLFMNLNIIQGFFYLYKKKGDGTWEKSKRK